MMPSWDPQFTEHHVLTLRRQMAIHDKRCTCCITCGRDKPAQWRWFGPGVLSLLCDDCFGLWTENARDDPSLAPTTVSKIN
jgi:hypothetical protein